jgi:hypothetical protein
MIVRLQLPSYFNAFRKMLTVAYSITTPNIYRSRFLGTHDPVRGPIWKPTTIPRISGNASSSRSVPCIQPVMAVGIITKASGLPLIFTDDRHTFVK